MGSGIIRGDDTDAHSVYTQSDRNEAGLQYTEKINK